MAKTALELTPGEREVYHPLQMIEQRRKVDSVRIDERWELAQRIVRQAASMLYEKYGAERVVLFGSAADRPSFTLWSDIDLAAWGILPERFFATVAALTCLSGEIRIDLVDPEHCSPALSNAIQEGVVL